MTPPRPVGSRYRVGAAIARGGMATVYRGHDEQLGRAVAIKLMRADLGEDPRFVQRFEAEARRAASVNHANLVAIYDVGTEDGTPYIVMELIDGEDLAAVIRREAPIDPERAAAIGTEVAAALEAAHAAGLVHRDVKPGNVLLGQDGRPRVADFGIARATGEDGLTRTGAMLGSVEYFSPEQARGEPATPASDVYALGVVLYELLTGTRPFGGDTPYAVATVRLRSPVPDPRAANAHVPIELAEIVQRAMAVDPARRFASASDLRASLNAWLAGRRSGPAAAAPGTRMLESPPRRPAEPAAFHPRRRSAIPWIAAVAVVLLLIGGFAGMRIIEGLQAGTLEISGGIVVGTPGGESDADPTPPSTTPEPAPERTPATTPSPTAVPAAAPPPATPQPPTPRAVALAGAPDASVATFYDAVVRGDFDAAYALWSDRMKATYRRSENLDERFAETAQITFTQLSVASQSGDDATVQANFTERYDGGGSRDFIGYWRLVRVDGAWLLDEPNY